MSYATLSKNILNNKDPVLAINGGVPIRSKPMPARFAISNNERAKLLEMMDWYQTKGQDPCYQGYFEEQYCQAFSKFQGGGYSDAVATGTVALYVCLAALELPKGSEVLVSPITDPGTLSAIILQGLKPKLIDSVSNSFNVGPLEVSEQITENTTCALIVHAAGQAAEIDTISEICHKKGLKVLEDCSQAHGAIWKSKKVGTFGDIAAFSTMYRKASITGPSGGVVFSQNEDLFHKAMAYADRGKPRWKKDFDDRDPNQFLFPALNLHSNEFACAIGLASLERLPQTIERRLAYLDLISSLINDHSKVCAPSKHSKKDDSPFYFPVFVDETKISCSKTEFAKAILAEGIGLNPHYKYLVQDWPWVKPYLVDNFDCKNARSTRDSVFCLYLNENYGEEEAEDTINAILKVEQYYQK